MYRVQMHEMNYPLYPANENNEAIDLGRGDYPNEEELIEYLKTALPSLGGTYGRWIEINKE